MWWLMHPFRIFFFILMCNLYFWWRDEDCPYVFGLLLYSACCHTHLLTTYSWFLKTHLANMDLILTSSLECHCLLGEISFPVFMSKDKRVGSECDVVILWVMYSVCYINMVVWCTVVARSLPCHSWFASELTCLLTKIFSINFCEQLHKHVNIENSHCESVHVTVLCAFVM